MINEESVKEYFGRELRVRMAYNDLHSYDMSYYCQISASNMTKYRRGERFPNVWELVLLAERLECTVNELLGYDIVETIGKRKISDVCPGKNHYAIILKDQIIHYMIQANMTVEMLAERTGISISTIERWLDRWPHLPRTDHLLRLADALNCTPSDLLGY